MSKEDREDIRRSMMLLPSAKLEYIEDSARDLNAHYDQFDQPERHAGQMTTGSASRWSKDIPMPLNFEKAPLVVQKRNSSQPVEKR